MRFLFSQREKARRAAIEAHDLYHQSDGGRLATGERQEYWSFVINAALEAIDASAYVEPADPPTREISHLAEMLLLNYPGVRVHTRAFGLDAWFKDHCARVRVHPERRLGLGLEFDDAGEHDTAFTSADAFKLIMSVWKQ